MKEVEAKKVVLSSKYSSVEKFIEASRNTPICIIGMGIMYALLFTFLKSF